MAAVVYLVPDLFFAARILEAARQLGLEVESARDAEALAASARGARLVLLDLRSPDALRALELLAADPPAPAVPVVGFVDHERVEMFERARAKGCRVLSKRQFSSDLPGLLAGC